MYFECLHSRSGLQIATFVEFSEVKKVSFVVKGQRSELVVKV